VGELCRESLRAGEHRLASRRASASRSRALLPPPVVQAVTAAAKLSIEMGKGMLWFAVLAASLAVFQLLQGAAGRGRDSFHAAAASLITLMILAFAQSALSGSAVVLCWIVPFAARSG